VRDSNPQPADAEHPRHVVGLEFVGLSGPARTRIEGFVERRLKSASGRA